MISKMSLLQYLSEETYQTICDRLDLDGSSRKIKGKIVDVSFLLWYHGLYIRESRKLEFCMFEIESEESTVRSVKKARDRIFSQR